MPLIDYPQHAYLWTTDKSDPVHRLPQLLAQTGGGVPNCAVPDRIIRFVRGGHYNTLISALTNHWLYANPNSVTDRGKSGSLYIYFRVMLQGETPANMAFNSVGSSAIEYKTRMVFDTRIWTQSRGGYVCSYDAGGRIDATPFSQAAQKNAFDAILRQKKFARGSAEVAIYSSVSMSDLTSAWVLFPYSLERIQRHLSAPASSPPAPAAPKIITPNVQSNPPVGQSVHKPVHSVKPSADLRGGRSGIRLKQQLSKQTRYETPLQVAAQRYKTLLSYLPHAEQRDTTSDKKCHWIKFSLSGGKK